MVSEEENRLAVERLIGDAELATNIDDLTSAILAYMRSGLGKEVRERMKDAFVNKVPNEDRKRLLEWSRAFLDADKKYFEEQNNEN